MLLALSVPAVEAGAAEPAPPGVAAFRVEGDGIRAPLDGRVGDAARGRALVHDTGAGACILCHTTPDNPLPVAGNVGPALAGAGSRLTAAQLRLRIVDSTRINAATAMPAYHRIDGLTRVGSA